MKLAVTGSRHWKDHQKIEAALSAIDPRPTVIIHGGADGADKIADRWARTRGIPTATVLAGYPCYARDLLARNSVIVDLADKVIAFRAAGKSNGTDNTIAKAEAAGKLLAVVREDA